MSDTDDETEEPQPPKRVDAVTTAAIEEELAEYRRLLARTSVFAFGLVALLAALDHTIPSYMFSARLNPGADATPIEVLCISQVELAHEVFSQVVGLRYAVVTLGGIMMVLGSMLTIAGIKASYTLAVKGESVDGTLRTTSPGLVLISLSALVLVASLYRSQEFDYTPSDRCLIALAPRPAPAVAPPRIEDVPVAVDSNPFAEAERLRREEAAAAEAAARETNAPEAGADE